MTQHLPPSLLALFAPRPPIPYIHPIELPKLPPYNCLTDFVKEFEDPNTSGHIPEPGHPFETKEARKRRLNENKLRKHKLELDEAAASWEPAKDPKATADPYHTLFVGRLNYATSDHKLKREFEVYGPIRKIRVVSDQNGKPRGYAFVEFERERDMKNAFKHADGKKIDGRRIVVDVERGRTVRNWRPRRLGAGLGFTRRGGENVNQKFSGREPPSLNEERDEREKDRDSKDRERDVKPERDHKRERERSKEREKSPRGEKDRDREHKERGDKEDRDRTHKDKDRDRERSDHHKHRERSRERKDSDSRSKRH